MFSYSEFVAKVKQDGLAHQNRFYVSIVPPSFISSAASNYFNAGTAIKDVHLLCKSVSLPGVNVVTAPVRYTGETFEYPYDRSFGPVTLTFYIDRQMVVRKFFDEWVNSVQNYQTREMLWHDMCKADTISIYILDKQNTSMYQVVLFDATIKTIGNLQLDQQTPDVMIFDVTFDYHYYTTSLLTGAPGTTTDPNASTSSAEYFNNLSDTSSETYDPMWAFIDSIGMDTFYNDMSGFQTGFEEVVNNLVSPGPGRTQPSAGIPSLDPPIEQLSWMAWPPEAYSRL